MGIIAMKDDSFSIETHLMCLFFCWDKHGVNTKEDYEHCSYNLKEKVF